jgi:hypothetical protein
MEQRIKNMEKRQRGFAIGRIYNVHPGSGKRYYLRMLLKTVKGCMSYEDIRTVDGVVYPTFKEVCQVLGYLDDDNEWIQCINESTKLGKVGTNCISYSLPYYVTLKYLIQKYYGNLHVRYFLKTYCIVEENY